jgi:hypothetical protein
MREMEMTWEERLHQTEQLLKEKQEVKAYSGRTSSSTRVSSQLLSRFEPMCHFSSFV